MGRDWFRLASGPTGGPTDCGCLPTSSHDEVARSARPLLTPGGAPRENHSVRLDRDTQTPKTRSRRVQKHTPPQHSIRQSCHARSPRVQSRSEARPASSTHSDATTDDGSHPPSPLREPLSSSFTTPPLESAPDVFLEGPDGVCLDSWGPAPEPFTGGPPVDPRPSGTLHRRRPSQSVRLRVRDPDSSDRGLRSLVGSGGSKTETTT